MAGQPEITKIPGGYSFDWAESHIKIAVSRIRTKSDDIFGEIAITTDLPTYKPHLHQAKFNFSGGNARRDLRKEMESVIPDIDWQSILEQLCRAVLQKQRTGSPVILLGMGDDDIKPPEYAIYPILPKNEATIIFGEGGAGKSYLALYLAACAAIKWYDNPLNLETYRPYTVLYLDYERSENLMRWRKKCLINGGAPPFEMCYRRCNVPIVEDVSQIQALMADTGANLLIVDSIGAACGADLNAAESATMLFNALRELDTTVLLLAHTSKDFTTKKKSIFGSVYFWNEATAVWELRKIQEVGADSIDIGLFNRKFNAGKLHDGVGMCMTFSENATTLTPKAIRDIPDFSDNLSQKDKILSMVNNIPMSCQEIANALSAEGKNISEATVRTTFSREVKSFPMRYKHTADNKWVLNDDSQ